MKLLVFIISSFIFDLKLKTIKYMKKIIITPKYDSTDMEELLEFASNTYKIGMQCTQFNDSTIIFKTLTESDFPFRISNVSENCICTNSVFYMYNKGTFRPYQIELQDDEYYFEKDKHYQIETVDGYFPIFVTLKTEIYKTVTDLCVKELVSHKKQQLFGINTLCNFNAINIIEITPLEYIQHKQSILSGTEPTRQELYTLKSKPNVLIDRDIEILPPNLYGCNSHPSLDQITLDLEGRTPEERKLDNSKTNGLQPFSIKLELDSLNTKSNMDLNPLN